MATLDGREVPDNMIPDTGFNLISVDYFAGEVYLVGHFEMYSDALAAKKSKRNQDGFLIVYRAQGQIHTR